jgi:hypothetical protein
MTLTCHFCGSTRVKVWEDWRPHFHVACDRCGAQGPRAASEQDATLWWTDGYVGAKQVRRFIGRRRRAERAEAKARENSPEAWSQRLAEMKAQADAKWARERRDWLAAPIDEGHDHV